MNRIVKSILPSALLMAGAVQLRADSVTLKTGEKLTGTIRAETDTELTIDVPMSGSITDERVIEKTDIAKIDKDQPDDIAFNQLMAVQPNAILSFSSDQYDKIIASLEGFQKQYPASAHLDEIKKLEATFQDEKSKVDEGQVKYLGEWISGREAQRQQSQIEGIQYYGVMQQQASAGDLLGAMQTYDLIEKQYSGTRSYPPAVALAQQVLARLQQDLVMRMRQVAADQAQLRTTLAATAEPEKTKIAQAAKARSDEAAETVAAAQRSGAKWVPLIPLSSASISALQRTVPCEIARLHGIQTAPMLASLEKVDAARLDIAGKDWAGAALRLQEATNLWSKNEAASYWRIRLNEEKPTPTPKPTPKKASPKPIKGLSGASPGASPSASPSASP